MLMFRQKSFVGSCKSCILLLFISIAKIYLGPICRKKITDEMNSVCESTRLGWVMDNVPPRWIKPPKSIQRAILLKCNVRHWIHHIPLNHQWNPWTSPTSPHFFARKSLWNPRDLHFFRMPRSLLPLSFRAGPPARRAEAAGRPGGCKVGQGGGSIF